MRKRLAITMISAGVMAGFVFGAPALRTRSTGSIRGIVTDPSGAAVAGARVTVMGTGAAQTFTTDGSGEYAAAVAPGQYAVGVDAAGFAPFEKPGFVVEAGKRSEADAPLGIATVRQTITVRAARS